MEERHFQEGEYSPPFFFPDTRESHTGPVLLYIDDKAKNIEAAEKAGLTALCYTDNDDEIISKITSLI